MKKDQKKTLREQDKNSLQKRLTEISKELVNRQMEFTMGKLKNIHAKKVLRKEIAVIKTILSEKEVK